MTSVSHDPHDMCKTAAAVALTASSVVVNVDKSKFSVKSAVFKVKGSTRVSFFLPGLTAEQLYFSQQMAF